MAEQDILEGKAADWRIGTSGNRYCLRIMIDDISISPDIKAEINNAQAKHALDGRSPLISLRDFIRHQKIKLTLLK